MYAILKGHWFYASLSLLIMRSTFSCLWSSWQNWWCHDYFGLGLKTTHFWTKNLHHKLGSCCLASTASIWRFFFFCLLWIPQHNESVVLNWWITPLILQNIPLMHSTLIFMLKESEFLKWAEILFYCFHCRCGPSLWTIICNFTSWFMAQNSTSITSFTLDSQKQVERVEMETSDLLFLHTSQCNLPTALS